MSVTETIHFEKTDIALPGPCLIGFKRFSDTRGFFSEVANAREFEKLGLPFQFVQENQSVSKPGVLRGLHFQKRNPQGRLIQVVSGEIFDVIVDIRSESATFGQHACLRLSDQQDVLLWIPAGFAHGFCVLGDKAARVFYKVDAAYDPEGEGGILWNDPDLKIAWPVSAPILSEKDVRLPLFSHLKAGRS